MAAGLNWTALRTASRSMTTAGVGAAGFWTMSRVVGFMASRRGERPPGAGWALSFSEGYRLSRWQTVRAVARGADARHVELGNNGKARGQRKVGRRARALHGHRCLSGFICFTGGLGNNGKQRRDRGHLHEGFCGGLKTVHGLICGISRHGERRRNRRGLRFRYGLCSVVRASVRRPFKGSPDADPSAGTFTGHNNSTNLRLQLTGQSHGRGKQKPKLSRAPAHPLCSAHRVYFPVWGAMFTGKAWLASMMVAAVAGTTGLYPLASIVRSTGCPETQ